MAADAAIKANISGDASGLIAALEQAKQGVTKFGNDAARILDRKLGLKDVFKGVLQGIGIASVGQIADKVATPFKEAAESAQKLEQYTQRAADATERLIRSRQDDNQQLDTLLKKMERYQKESERAANAPASKRFLGFIERGSGIDKLFGFSAREDAKKQESIAENTALASETAVEAEQKKAQIKQKQATEDAKYLREMIAEEDKRKAATKKYQVSEKEAALEKMTAEERLISLSSDKAKLDEEVAQYAKLTKEGTQGDAEQIERLNDLKTKQRDLEKEIAEITKSKADAELLIGKTVTSNIAEWEKFKIAITSTGRGDKELSDRELERKIQNIKQAQFESEVNRINRIGVGNEGGFDPFGGINANNLAQAQAELALRNRVRQYTASFGEERAFGMFPGVTEQRFAEINQSNTKQDEANNLLRDIKRRLDGGILTLPTNVIKGGG